MVESDLAYFKNRRYRLEGVVHVGANDGAEVDWYIANNCTPILCFEPHPKAVQRAIARYGSQQGLTYIQCALGEEEGSLEFLIPVDEDDEKTSRYRPIDTPGHDWTSVPTGSTITVPVFRFDNWCQRNHVDIKAYNCLVIDAQGMELEVLKGFGYYLDSFDFLSIELSQRPVYEGEASAAEVIKFLSDRYYHQLSEVKEHDDVMFVRANALHVM